MACALPPPFHSPPRSGRPVGRGAACRLSSVGRLCRVAQRAIALFSLACSTAHSPVLPVPLFSFLQPIAPRRKKKKRKRIPNPEAITHTRPNQSQNRRKVGLERKHTHHFFLICPREPTLNKVIDHLCHFAWGGLGEQNVSLSSPPTRLTASFITVPPRLSRSKSGRCCILQGSSPASVRDACVRAWYGIGGKVP